MHFESLLANFDRNPAPSPQEKDQLLQKIDFPIDPAYLGFLWQHNGAYGEIGNWYLALLDIDEMCALNPYYPPETDGGYSGGLFFIGSNGGDGGFAIRKKDGMFIEVPYIGMSDEEATEMGDSFLSFLQYLAAH